MGDDGSNAQQSIVDALRRAPPFQDLDQAALRTLATIARWVKLQPTEQLFKTGDWGDGCYLVTDGLLEARFVKDGETQVLGSIGAGDIVGEMQVLIGGRRSADVVALETSSLLHLSTKGVGTFFENQPDVANQLVEVVLRRMQRNELQRVMRRLLDSVSLEILDALESSVSWRSIKRGEILYREGEAGDSLAFLVSGRLQASTKDEQGNSHVVGELTAGESVGEMTLLVDEPRSATVTAMRDSVLAELSRRAFEELSERFPALTLSVAKSVVRRLQRSNRGMVRSNEIVNVALVPLSSNFDLKHFAHRLGKALESVGQIAQLDRAAVENLHGGTGGIGKLPQDVFELRVLPWLEELAYRHRFVIYETEPEVTPWSRCCLRQADTVLLVGEPESQLNDNAGRFVSMLQDLTSPPSHHLVLVHESRASSPVGTRKWSTVCQPENVFHVCTERDFERLGRFLAGRTVSLVLGGGGARGAAHIGVIRALSELGFSIDVVSGSSAGAGIAAQYAMGLTPGEMVALNKKGMIEMNPFGLYTLPIYSLFSRRRMDEVAQAMYGNQNIEDLWIPLVCISCDLSTGNRFLHREGELWRAMRATTALPGLATPVFDVGRMLVDGGIVDNVPVQVVRKLFPGTVLAVDVTPESDLKPSFSYEQTPSPWRVLWSRLNPVSESIRVPTMLDVLMRTATVSNVAARDLLKREADIFLRPPCEQFGILEFNAIEQMEEAAYHYVMDLFGQGAAPTPSSGLV